MSIFKWLENIWNLRLILDKYLPLLREMYLELKELKAKIEAEKEAEKTAEEEAQDGGIIYIEQDVHPID